MEDTISQAIAARAKAIDEEQTRSTEAHIKNLADLKLAEETARIERETKVKAQKLEQLRQLNEQKSAQEAQRRAELQAKADEDVAYSLEQHKLETERKRVEELEQQRLELEFREEQAIKAKRDAEALLTAKVDTERVVPNPLARFFQNQE
jgi:hypothetical protein